MLVSGFEWEYAPGSTTNPTYASGYQLEISNLSDTDIQFEVVARVTRYGFGAFAPPANPATVLANLKQLIPGVRKNDLWTWFDGEWIHDADGFALYVTMPVVAGTSELFDVVPSLFQSQSWWPRVAGHVELTVPAVRSLEPPYTWGPQAAGPVPVLLNPSTVETWEVHTGVPGGGGAFSHSRTSPPMSNGQAYNEIPAQAHPRPLRVSIRDHLAGLQKFGVAGLAPGVLALSPEQRAQVLIELLAAVDDDEAEQLALNEVLEGLGTSTRVVRSSD
jgi:hypothetical protein